MASNTVTGANGGIGTTGGAGQAGGTGGAGQCPSSDDLRHIAGFRKGGSGSCVIEIMRHAVDAASDGLRLFVV